MKLSIIIVSYNTKKLTLACVNSIKKFHPSFTYEIIIVDNSSTDGSVEALKKLGNKIVFIPSVKNLGFSKANNMAIQHAKGEFILLLNSDTEVTSNVFDALVHFGETHPDAGVVAPRLLNTDSTTQASIYRLPTLSKAIQQYWFGKKNILNKYAIEKGDAIEVESVVGAAFLLTPRALKEVGVLDPQYFMYFEDLDYCRRVRSHGLKVYYLPKLTLIHHHGASGNTSVNTMLVESSKKYFGTLHYWLYTFVLWSGQKLQQK